LNKCSCLVLECSFAVIQHFPFHKRRIFPALNTTILQSIYQLDICQFDSSDKRKMMELLVVMNNKQPLTHLGLDLEAVNIFCIAE
jgi:hypothetical protein